MKINHFSFALSFVVLFSFIYTSRGLSQPRGRIVSIDNSVFVAMVDQSIEDCICIQEKSNWCWAACVQMILRYNGYWERQEDIVSEVYADSYNWTASGNEIAETFNGWYGFTVRSYKSKSPQSFINEIAAGHPLIIGYGEHAYLLTHIYYKKSYDGGLKPFKIVMINPYNGREVVSDWNDVYSSLNTIVSFY